LCPAPGGARNVIHILRTLGKVAYRRSAVADRFYVADLDSRLVTMIGTLLSI